MIEGAESLIKKLSDIDTEMQKRIVHKAVGRGIQTVRAEAVLLCPVDTGELRGSIMTTVEDDSEGNATGTVYTNKEYAPYVEFGTGPVGQSEHDGISPDVSVQYRQKGWSYLNDEGEWQYTNGQPAQPFLYPALKNNEERVTKQIKEDIRKELEGFV